MQVWRIWDYLHRAYSFATWDQLSSYSEERYLLMPPMHVSTLPNLDLWSGDVLFNGEGGAVFIGSEGSLFGADGQPVTPQNVVGWFPGASLLQMTEEELERYSVPVSWRL